MAATDGTKAINWSAQAAFLRSRRFFAGAGPGPLWRVAHRAHKARPAMFRSPLRRKWPRGGITVYTASAATGSADVPTATLAVNTDVPSAATNRGAVSENFFATVIGSVCGNPEFETIGGLVTGTVSRGAQPGDLFHTVRRFCCCGPMRTLNSTWCSERAACNSRSYLACSTAVSTSRR